MSLLVDSSGLHPSSTLSLAALEWLETRITPRKVLDIGCGNGLLSFTAAHLWGAQVMACDISPRALADMRENQREHAPDAVMTILHSDGLKHPAIGQAGPYDLVIANLLAQWQIGMAKPMASCLAPRGVLLLSGALLWQEEALLAAFESINIIPFQKFSASEWQSYLCCHKTDVLAWAS